MFKKGRSFTKKFVSSAFFFTSVLVNDEAGIAQVANTNQFPGTKS